MMSDLKLWPMEDAGLLVRIDKHNLPDLDDLMLDVLQHEDLDFAVDSWKFDDVTQVNGSNLHEGRVGFYRMNPCTCEDHRFHLGHVRMDDDGNPIGKAARGAFLGVFFE